MARVYVKSSPAPDDGAGDGSQDRVRYGRVYVQTTEQPAPEPEPEPVEPEPEPEPVEPVKAKRGKRPPAASD